MRGWSLDGDHQTPMDSVGEPVRGLQAEEQPPHISGAGTKAGCECLPLCHLWFLLSFSHFPRIESQGLSLTAKMKINPALSPWILQQTTTVSNQDRACHGQQHGGVDWGKIGAHMHGGQRREHLAEAGRHILRFFLRPHCLYRTLPFAPGRKSKRHAWKAFRDQGEHSSLFLEVPGAGSS